MGRELSGVLFGDESAPNEVVGNKGPVERNRTGCDIGVRNRI